MLKKIAKCQTQIVFVVRLCNDSNRIQKKKNIHAFSYPLSPYLFFSSNFGSVHILFKINSAVILSLLLDFAEISFSFDADSLIKSFCLLRPSSREMMLTNAHPFRYSSLSSTLLKAFFNAFSKSSVLVCFLLRRAS